MPEWLLPDAAAGAIALTALGSYLLGAIPFGLILTRLTGRGDVRKIGSGSIGATNVLRTGSKLLAALTLALDCGKGAAAVLAAAHASPELGPLAALCAVSGHMFPLWLRFRGGKGGAAALGACLAMAWPVGLCAMATWLAVLFATRVSSLATLIGAALTPVYAWYFADPRIATVAAILAVLIVCRHKDNIRRLSRGEEPKIGAKKR